MPKYAALWCKTNYSFLEGASHPDELIEEAQSYGVRAIAVTDRDGVYGIVRAHIKAREIGAKLIVGAQVSVDDGSNIVLLASNREGYANICRLLTKGRLRCVKGESKVNWLEVCEHAPGVIALWGGDNSALVGDEYPDQLAYDLRSAFDDRLYAVVTRHRRAQDVPTEIRLRHRADKYGLPCVAAVEVLYHSKGRRRLQDVMTCIRHKVTLATAGRITRGNAEHELKSPHAFEVLFKDDPAGVARTIEIASRCEFSMDKLRYRYPSERLPDGRSSAEWLVELAYQGANKRYNGPPPADVVAQLDKELALIDELEYCGYFLTMYEIVRFCREQNILCQGRGSAANSAVCFCLGITAVDPVRMGLLFERFLSRERAEPPDIDLDIEHERREEVIQHVYTKYGRTHSAMVANFIRYRPKSAVRDVGKVLSIPETSLDRAAKMLGRYEGVFTEPLEQAGLAMSVATHEHLVELSNEILDFPRHLSIHPGGFLLGHEPVHDLVPIENGTMADRTVIQWDKNDLEDLGLFKVDLLGLGALAQMHRCFDIIESHRGRQWTMATIPADDSDTYDMICRSDTVGVFQIESRAQMAMLPRLRPRFFYDLVVEVSIVRPGPITGGMVHPYLRRRNGEEQVEYPHECLRPVLEKTLGVPLFQEQVMRLAVVAADYTPGEADQLRRDMAAWRRTGRIEQHRQKLIERMTKKGIAFEFAERVFNQIRGFGEYGFPESHAASFALIAYGTAWLKCHYPAEFACSLLNAQPMGFYSPATIVEDAKRHEVEFRPIDVSLSNWDCTLEHVSGQGDQAVFAVRMGLRYVRGLGDREWQRILAARDRREFKSLSDFVTRTYLDERCQTKLAEAGAFGCFSENRRSALWDVRGLLRTREDEMPRATRERAAAPGFASLNHLEQVLWDYQTSSHSVHGHPLQPLREELRRRRLPDARTLNQGRDGQRVHYAGIVICRQRPGTAGGVTFMTLEDETGFVNTVIWKQVFDQYATIAKTTAFLGITGKLQAQQGVVHLVAEKLWEPMLPTKPVNPRSRDFH